MTRQCVFDSDLGRIDCALFVFFESLLVGLLFFDEGLALLWRLTPVDIPELLRFNPDFPF